MKAGVRSGGTAARSRRAIAATGRDAPRRAFTLIELMVVLAVLAVLVGLAAAAIGRARQASAQTACLINLRTIGHGFFLYANDNGGLLPYVQKSSPQWEDLLMDHGLRRDNFLCPADVELAPALGSSYDWRDAGPPTPANPTSLAGRRLQAVHPDLILSFEALPGWHRPNTLSVVRTDSSVDTVDQQTFTNNLACPVFK